jgi:hypothetical protein
MPQALAGKAVPEHMRGRFTDLINIGTGVQERIRAVARHDGSGSREEASSPRGLEVRDRGCGGRASHQHPDHQSSRNRRGRLHAEKSPFGEMRASGVRDVLIYCRDRRRISSRASHAHAAAGVARRCGRRSRWPTRVRKAARAALRPFLTILKS